MNLFFVMIFLGGMGARPDQKIGFWKRVLWPSVLGVVLYDMALDYIAARNVQDDGEATP